MSKAWGNLNLQIVLNNSQKVNFTCKELSDKSV